MVKLNIICGCPIVLLQQSLFSENRRTQVMLVEAGYAHPASAFPSEVYTKVYCTEFYLNKQLFL